MNEVFRPFSDQMQFNLDKIIKLHQYVHDPEKYYAGQQRIAEDNRERLRQERIIRENKLIKPQMELPQVLELINEGKQSTDALDREFQRVSLFYMTQLERLKRELAAKETEARLPQTLYAIQQQQAELIQIEALIRTMLEEGVSDAKKLRELRNQELKKCKDERQAEFIDRYAILKRLQNEYEQMFKTIAEDSAGDDREELGSQFIDNDEAAWGTADPPDTVLERKTLSGKLFGDYALEQLTHYSKHMLPIRAPTQVMRALQFNPFIYKYKGLAFVPPSGFNPSIFDLEYEIGHIIAQKQLEWKRRISVTELNLIYGLICAVVWLFPGVVYVKRSKQDEYLEVKKLFAMQSRRLEGILGISMLCKFDRLTKERYIFTLAVPFRHGKTVLLPYDERVEKGKFAIDDKRILEIYNVTINKIRSSVLL